jgi:hypothetical protein
MPIRSTLPSRCRRSSRDRLAFVLGIAALATVSSPRTITAQTLDSLAASSTRPFRCLDTAATIHPARLDARHLIFAEQQTVSAQPDGRILVAGNPVWVWKDRGTGYDMLAKDSVFGMVVDSTEIVRAIPSPLPGRVLEGMRAAALPDGWWMVSFADVIPAEVPKQPTVLGMWVGETDGVRWRRVQKLPVVADSLNIGLSSALAWREGRARLAVPYWKDHRFRVVLYSLDDGRWRGSVNDFGPVAAVAVHLTRTRDLIAVVMPFVDSIPDVNSLFFYTKRPQDTAWSARRNIVRSGKEMVLDPLFTDYGTPLLSWRKVRNGQQEWDAWFTTYDESRDSIAPPTRLTTGAIEITAASRGDHVEWAISDRAWPGPSVQLLETDDTKRGARLDRDTRYRGLFGLAITRGRVVLIAAQSAATPREASVVSMIETHTWRCR